MVQRRKNSDRARAGARRKAAPNDSEAEARPGEVTDETPLAAGDRVQIEWGGSWWQGSVIRVEDDGQVRITYQGYDSSWDETVPRQRLWLPGHTPGSGAKAAASNSNPGPVETDPIQAALSSRPVTAQTPLDEGDAVRVLWGGQWWAGTIVRLEDDGQVRIHYDGWASSYDETVQRNRLTLATERPRTLSVTLDNQQTLSGVLVSSAGEFVILLREGGVRSFVSKQKILFMDVREED